MTTQTIYQRAAAFVVPKGMAHAGETLGEIAKTKSGMNYIGWLAKQFQPRDEELQRLKAAAQAFLAGPQNQTPTSASAKPKPAPNGNGHKPTQPQARTNGKANGHKPAPNGNGKSQKTESGEHRRIFSLMTNKAFLHFEDALSIGKIKVFMGSYVKGQGSKDKVIHYLDVDDARVIAFDLAVRGSLSTKFVDYKGSPKGLNGKPLSRVLKIEDRGNEAKRPIVIEAANGPGEVIGQGAIKPKGKPTSEVVLFLTRWEARRLGHALQAYLNAWETAKMTLTPPETISG